MCGVSCGSEPIEQLNRIVLNPFSCVVRIVNVHRIASCQSDLVQIQAFVENFQLDASLDFLFTAIADLYVFQSSRSG